MLFYPMLKYQASTIAGAAVYLARFMSKEAEPWTPTLHHVTKFNAWALKDCVLDLQRVHRVENEVMKKDRSSAKAVSEKYAADKYHAASAVPYADAAALEKSFLKYSTP